MLVWDWYSHSARMQERMGVTLNLRLLLDRCQVGSGEVLARIMGQYSSDFVTCSVVLPSDPREKVTLMIDLVVVSGPSLVSTLDFSLEITKVCSIKSAKMKPYSPKVQDA